MKAHLASRREQSGAALLKPFVIHSLAATLPVEVPHDFVRFIDENVHGAVRWDAACLPNMVLTPIRMSVGVLMIRKGLFSLRLNIKP